MQCSAWWRRSSVLIGLTLVFAVAAAAQTSTGRHRGGSADEPQRQREILAATPDSLGYWVGVGAGLATSGDLFRLRTAGVSGILWTPGPGVRFQSNNILVTLDEDLALAAGVGIRLRGPLWLRVDGSVATIDMAAKARVGEGVEVFAWDRLSFTLLGLEAEYRLTSQRSFPYLLVGGGLAIVSGEFDSQFDQSRPLLRFGAGWQQALVAQWALRAEIRDAIIDLDFAGYVPPVEGNLVPEYTIEDRGPVHAFEILLSLAGYF